MISFRYKIVGMIDQIKCTHCNRQIFPFSVYLEIDKEEELVAFCDQDCLNKWYINQLQLNSKLEIVDDGEDYDQH